MKLLSIIFFVLIFYKITILFLTFYILINCPRGIIHGSMARFRRDPRELDEDEETWFDEEEEGVVLESTPPPPSIASLPRLSPPGISKSLSPPPTSPSSPPHVPLFGNSPRPTLIRSTSPVMQLKMPSVSSGCGL